MALAGIVRYILFEIGSPGHIIRHAVRQGTVFLAGIIRMFDGMMPDDGVHGSFIMAGGWARDDAVHEQIDASVEDAVARARSRMPRGESLSHCAECDAPIPEARREALPGVRLCVTCQSEQDKANAAFSGYNRRGSKDSQLR